MQATTNGKPKRRNRGLTDTEIRKAKATDKAVKMSDGGGLYIQVNPTGSKLWRLAYRYNNAQRTDALGEYPYVSLVDARNKREEIKTILARGGDPRGSKAKGEEGQEVATFEAVARQWHETVKSRWKNDKTANEALRLLQENVFPTLGGRPMSEIRPRDLRTCLEEIAEQDHSPIRTMRDTGRYCSNVFDFAIGLELAEFNPWPSIRNTLKPTPRKKEMKRLPQEELGEFMLDLENYGTKRSKRHRIALAFELLIHTMLRRQEVLGACWSEFEDLEGDSPMWRLPDWRMKMGREHLVPLSPQAVAIILKLRELCPEDSEFVFPDQTKAGIVCKNVLRDVLVNLGYKDRADVHGFRGVASTILNEQGQFNGDWIERQLAHMEGNATRAAYNKAEWMPQRRKMLTWWSNYLEDAKAEKKTKLGILFRACFG